MEMPLIGRQSKVFDKVQLRLSLSPSLDVPENEIRTSKYTLYSFLPINLYEQITNPVNIGFLFMAVL